MTADSCPLCGVNIVMVGKQHEGMARKSEAPGLAGDREIATGTAPTNATSCAEFGPPKKASQVQPGILITVSEREACGVPMTSLHVVSTRFRRFLM
jgi:hypothetical protein